MCTVTQSSEHQAAVRNSKTLCSDDIDNRRRKSTRTPDAAPSTKPETSSTHMMRRIISFVDLAEREESKKPAGRRVSFSEDMSESLNSSYTLTTSRKLRMWYNSRELAELREGLWHLIDNGLEQEEEEESLRGLELYMDSDRFANSEERNQIMLEHVHSIRKAGMDDSFDIESLASSLNEASIRMSDIQAAQDSTEAYLIYLETMDPSMVNSCFRTH
jgi:hypothetical protein